MFLKKIFLALLLFPSLVLAKDLALYDTPNIKGTLTDGPCPAAVVAVAKGMNADEALLASLKEFKLSYFHGLPLAEACYLPKDEDGDYPVVDGAGRVGFLLNTGIKMLVKEGTKI